MEVAKNTYKDHCVGGENCARDCSQRSPNVVRSFAFAWHFSGSKNRRRLHNKDNSQKCDDDCENVEKSARFAEKYPRENRYENWSREDDDGAKIAREIIR